MLIRNNWHFIFAIALFQLTGCTHLAQKKVDIENTSKTNETSEESLLINLTESTEIIRCLLKENNLAIILEEEDATPEAIQRLINNTSPVALAFESEVFSYGKPVAAIFFDPTQDYWQKLKPTIIRLAQEFNGHLKFVLVDITELYSLISAVEIEALPALVVYHNNYEEGRIYGILDPIKFENIFKDTFEPILK